MKATLSVFLTVFVLCLGIASPAWSQSNSPPLELVIEAFVDGPSTLHIAQTGIYWTNGWAAKPGRVSAQNLPTYINTREWIPKWSKDGDDRGEDRSDTYKMNLPYAEYQFDILAIADKMGSSRKQKRTPPLLVRRNGELCIDIPDPEPGAKWYRFRLKPTKKQ